MTAKKSVLIVEDDKVMSVALAKHLARSYRVLSAGTCSEARSLFAHHRVDLAILDINLPDGDGLSLVEFFRQDDETEVVTITAYPKVQTAVRALKAGAFDYINKPFELDELDIIVRKALEHRGLRDEVRAFRRQKPKGRGIEQILGESAAIARLREEILRVAATPSTTVSISGESGTGKELVAEAIHFESARRGAPLVRVNCPSIPSSMIETELFGHERGAFTDAKSARCGLIEAANSGTLLLDEIGDLPLELQPKLLRVLESKCIRRVGGNREFTVDVRFVTSTNRDLSELAAAGAFRQDLLFRLKVFEIAVPPLRERRDDIPILTRHLLQQLGQRLGKTLTCSEEAMQRLTSYDWPGNVRELRNVIERAMILARDDELELATLPGRSDPAPLPPQCVDSCPAFPESWQSYPALAAIEKRYILCVYRKSGSNKTRAAAVLGMSRVTLRDKLKSYGVH